MEANGRNLLKFLSLEHLLMIRASTGFEPVTSAIPMRSPDFFQVSLFQLLKLEIHCEDHISPS